ncbi:unnamed protein product [Oreochromis niloticus]|nr:unnamed protein product [Mustela putorius furo]
MVRRSPCLQESGYYGQDGSPNISYKETSYKVFCWRKYRRRDPFMNPHTQQNKTRFLNLIITFLTLPLLTFGIVSYTIFTNSKQEVTSLRQQMTELPTENSAKWWLCKFMQWVDPSRAKRRVIQEYLPVPPGNCWPLQDNCPAQ